VHLGSKSVDKGEGAKGSKAPLPPGPSLFGGLDSGLDCGTGLWDWTQRKLR